MALRAMELYGTMNGYKYWSRSRLFQVRASALYCSNNSSYLYILSSLITNHLYRILCRQIFVVFLFAAATPRPLKPQAIWLAMWMSTPKSSAKLQTRPGFFWKYRPTIARSSPSSRSEFACLPSRIEPTVPTKRESPTLSLTALANGCKQKESVAFTQREYIAAKLSPE